MAKMLEDLHRKNVEILSETLEAEIERYASLGDQRAWEDAVKAYGRLARVDNLPPMEGTDDSR